MNAWMPREDSSRQFLKEFVERGDQHEAPRQNRRSPQTDNQGRAGGGDSRKSRKIRASREVYSIAETTVMKEELVGIELPYDDPVVIAPVIGNFTVERTLVDTGSSVDVLNLSTFYKLRLLRSLIKPLHIPLTGFTGHTIQVVGEVTLDFTVGKGTRISTIRAQLTIVDLEDSSYNRLIGRLILTVLHAIVSPVHLKMKFPTLGGIGETCGDQKKARICYQTSVLRLGISKSEPRRKQSRESHMEVNAIRNEDDNSPKETDSGKKSKPHEEVEEFPLNKERWIELFG
ncbi:hypothetical protein LIER_11290 [Lithospermum erythrorhizon]|uniref:Uncharacterized protein n=1 Tax=Lithospermum erythrorhizon TaxID=34254 RepID=A0AAV3PME8_LITER